MYPEWRVTIGNMILNFGGCMLEFIGLRLAMQTNMYPTCRLWKLYGAP